MGRIYFGGSRKSYIVIINAHGPWPFISLPCGYENKMVGLAYGLWLELGLGLESWLGLGLGSAKVEVLLFCRPLFRTLHCLSIFDLQFLINF